MLFVLRATKHINTVCGQNVGLLNVKPGGMYSNRWALGGHFRVGVTESARTCIREDTVDSDKLLALLVLSCRLFKRPTDP
jgi:hypothetical protein